jgi:DMSO/TMAO reductase YedYZ heme-binding membrane subunit
LTQKADISEHPLFKNRRRVLVVPASAEPVGRREARLWLSNLAVAALLFTLFISGVIFSNPILGETIGNIPGERWKQVMVKSLGEVPGVGLAEKSPWIMARVTGIIAYLMVFASVVLGLLVSLRLTDRFLQRASIVYIHKIISLSLMVFITMHVAGLMLDNYMKFSLSQSLVPFTAPYRPLWSGIGTICLYLIIAVVVSFYLTGRLGYKTWRMVHYLSFLIFIGAMLHGLLVGTDSKSDWMFYTYLVTGTIVFFLIGTRMFSWSGVRPKGKY